MAPFLRWALAPLAVTGLFGCATILGVDDDYVLGDAGACSHCADLVDGGDRNHLCSVSQPLFDDVLDCTCKQSCVAECQDDGCQFQPVGSACQDCIAAHCLPQTNACLADQSPPD